VVKKNWGCQEENLQNHHNRGSTYQFVFTSKRMLSWSFSKDPTPNTYVTMCGVSEADAYGEAYACCMCANAHHVLNWNDISLH
jgi:hypothetical protein